VRTQLYDIGHDLVFRQILLVSLWATKFWSWWWRGLSWRRCGIWGRKGYPSYRAGIRSYCNGYLPSAGCREHHATEFRSRRM